MKETMLAIAFVIAFVTVVMAVAFWLDSSKCNSQSTAMNVVWHEWGPLEGCMIQVREQRIPLQSYKVLAP